MCVFEDEPRHEVRHGLTRLFGEPAPFRHRLIAARRVRRSEQIALLGLAVRAHEPAVLAWHGRLPGSGRSIRVLRWTPEHSMRADGQARDRLFAQATPRAPTAPPHPRADRPQAASQGRRCGRTSRPELPARGLPGRSCGCSAEPYRIPCRLPRGHERRIRSRDASDRGPAVLPACRSCGCSVVALYNTVRPHASLGYKPPAPEVFIPGLAAQPAAPPWPAPPTALPLAPRPALN